MTLRAWAALVPFVAALGCDSGKKASPSSGGDTSSGSSSGSCDHRSDATNPSCTEIAGAASGVLAWKNGCDQPGEVWTDAAECPREGAIGGCKSPDPASPGTTFTIFYYAGGTDSFPDAAAVEAHCAGGGATYVAP